MGLEQLLRASEIRKRFGGVQALGGVDISVSRGERIGLIGPNGSGKTTLLNIISGVLRSDGGSIVFQGEDITKLPAYRRRRLGVSRTFQIPRPFASLTVMENVRLPLVYSGQSEGTDVGSKALQLLEKVGLSGKAGTTPPNLTQIEMRKMELARALAGEPKIMLLDEVMAGLTSNEVDEVLVLLDAFNKEGVAIIMVEHIMRAVMSFCGRITVLNMGTKIAEGKPEEVAKEATVVKAYLGE